ncbi:Uncharacterized protein SCG7086_AS_00030 [Chlamydiales bacterium SCGC AG-110-P3]|nr:Uncharacterized protein SCG7086_AS_00030 [Chlamydiales bacterium SCGC AG-110-P3]
MTPEYTFFSPEDEIRVDIGADVFAFGKIPDNAKGTVIFAHGSGSSRYSPRDQYVAQILYNGGLAVFIMDLLTRDEEAIDNVTRELRFDINFLARRLTDATEWITQHEEYPPPYGYFGASTGAAAALVAAAQMGNKITTVVSRGGRPDLAGVALSHVTAATQLIVGGNDFDVIELNKSAYAQLTCEKSLEIVPGATHLFEESGTLETAARLATQWFIAHQ